MCDVRLNCFLSRQYLHGNTLFKSARPQLKRVPFLNRNVPRFTQCTLFLSSLQTDVCGIKWSVFREPEAPISLDPSEDAVLQSYAQCLQAEFLSVWRRVPRRALVTYTYDQMGNQG